ncbi:MAG: hypothetical protein B7Z37_03485 [Verrucomicrobia bacterium 12-59-8]|nr:MAG: hypothetical protein B7Z37_03485 [Verrucomicrobia bacterium 12-59-8]
MKPLITFSLALIAFVSSSAAQEVQKFASDITNITWDLRGTANLKHLRFDGEKFNSLSAAGEPLGAFDHTLVDTGVFRFDYGKGRAGWYLVTDDLKQIMSANVIKEIHFKPEKSGQAKAVKAFPEDIKNVVWVGERDNLPAKLRWNGTTLEVGVKDPHWQVNFVQPVIANRRTLEFQLDKKTTIWLVFSADGSNAWWLTITDVYGGHRSGLQTAEAQTADLRPQQNDLANHAEDLLKADHPMTGATLVRELERKCAGNAEALEQLLVRFPSLK